MADLAAEALFGESSELYLRLYEEGVIDSSFGGGFETVDAELGATQLPETMAQVSVLIDDVTGTTTGTTDDSRNTAVGTGSLNSNTTGNNNTAMGFASLKSNTTGFSNYW